MTREQFREYNRKWMKEYRKRKKPQQAIESGHCPTCYMLLDPKFEHYHAGVFYVCSWYMNIGSSAYKAFHAKTDNSQGSVVELV